MPFKEYENTFQNEQLRSEYLSLLSRGDKIETLDTGKNKEESYLAAGKRVVDLADVMISVWDGEKAVGLGGTADIVKYARSCSKTIVRLNPLTKEIIES